MVWNLIKYKYKYVFDPSPGHQQASYQPMSHYWLRSHAGLILGLCPANRRQRYFVTTSLIGWVQTWNQPWHGIFCGWHGTYMYLIHFTTITLVYSHQFTMAVIKILFGTSDNFFPLKFSISITVLHFFYFDDKSTLVQVMAWCRQATSHYLRQCWPRSVASYGVTRPEWVKYTWYSAKMRQEQTRWIGQIICLRVMMFLSIIASTCCFFFFVLTTHNLAPLRKKETTMHI